MASSPVTIPPRRSLALFVALAMIMVLLSYLAILLLAIACVYVPWLVLTDVANFQTLALMVAGGIVAGSMIWSLIPRRDKFEAPGILLDRSHHPQLFAELDNIAAALREPLPCEVYLIGQANAFVADRGGVLGFGSRRVMGLGLPLLSALNISQFRAVLAHEFAHYYGGDTKLGPWLYRTKMAMIRTFQNMGSVGQAMRVAVMQVLYVVVFGILKGYWRLFLRAINFVSRRQEFRADELACIVAGTQPLASGLRSIHGAALAWPAFLKTELYPMFEEGCLPSITGGFARFLAAPAIAQQVEKGIETEIREGKVEPYDSHPPLRDRISAAEGLHVAAFPENTSPASTLLENIEHDEVKFLQFADPELMQKPLRRASWDERATTVVIPSWTSAVREYASLLQGITAGNLFDSLGRLPQIAPHIRDPKGMLLAPEQRIERARSLLATAVALAMLNNGWKLHSLPGEFYLERGCEQVNPFDLVFQLSNGTISPEAWTIKCKELGIEAAPLAETERVAAAASQDGLPFMSAGEGPVAS